MKSNNPKLKVISDNLIYAPLLWIATAMFWLERGDKILMVVVIICALTSLIINKNRVVKENWRSNNWLKWLLFLLVFALISDFYHGFGSREMRGIQTACIFLLFLDLRCLKASKGRLLMLLSSTSMLLASIYFQFIEPTPRAEWPTNALPFATYAALLTCTSLTAIKLTSNNKTKLILALSGTIALTALVFSESRGPLLSSIVVLTIYSLTNISFKKTKIKYLLPVTLIGITLAIAMAPTVNDRINDTKIELEKIQSGNYSTSIGLRLQVYSLGLNLFKEKPFLGYGKDNSDTYWDNLLEEKKITKSLRKMLGWDFHNQFLQTAVYHGVLGLMFMLIWLWLPMYYSLKQSKAFFYFASTPSLLYFLISLSYTPASDANSYVTLLIGIGIIMSGMFKYNDKESNTRGDSLDKA